MTGSTSMNQVMKSYERTPEIIKSTRITIDANIKWFTRTITTAISLETSKGEFAMGIALGLVLICIAFLANLSLYNLKKRSRER